MGRLNGPRTRRESWIETKDTAAGRCLFALEEAQPPEWAKYLDQLAGENGLMTNAVMRQHGAEDDSKSGEITVKGFSTIFTVCGTMLALLVWGYFAASTWSGWSKAEPSINERILKLRDSTRHDLPDIAITINIGDMNESEVLDYMWPEFRWKQWNSGFDDRRDNETLLDATNGVRRGEACGLKKGYDELTGTGSATWPVFCILQTELDQQSIRKQLQGRFGDETFEFLSIAVNRCMNNTTSATKLSRELSDAWSGVCASQEKVDQLFLDRNGVIGMNLWFKPKNENWNTWQRNDRLQDAKDWSWFIYQSLEKEIIHPLNIGFRLNTAALNDPMDWFESTRPVRLRWFNFDSFYFSPSGTSSREIAAQPFFLASIRVWSEREVYVHYQTLQEMLSEVSGSWTVSLLLGFMFSLLLQQLTGALHNVENDGVKALVPQLLRNKLSPPDTADACDPDPKEGPMLLADAHEVSALRNQMEKLERQLETLAMPKEELPPPPTSGTEVVVKEPTPPPQPAGRGISRENT
jgi:hypothetical protein